METNAGNYVLLFLLCQQDLLEVVHCLHSPLNKYLSADHT